MKTEHQLSVVFFAFPVFSSHLNLREQKKSKSVQRRTTWKVKFLFPSSSRRKRIQWELLIPAWRQVQSNCTPSYIFLGRYLHQRWTCGWNPAPDLCMDSKWWEENLLSLWAGCFARLLAISLHHLQLSSLYSIATCTFILLLFLSLTVWKADAMNIFPDGRTEEACPFLLWKVPLPKLSSSVLSCCSLATSGSESGLRAAKSVLCSLRQSPLLPGFSFDFSNTWKKHPPVSKSAFDTFELKEIPRGSGKSYGRRAWENPPSGVYAELPGIRE